MGEGGAKTNNADRSFAGTKSIWKYEAGLPATYCHYHLECAHGVEMVCACVRVCMGVCEGVHMCVCVLICSSEHLLFCAGIVCTFLCLYL